MPKCTWREKPGSPENCGMLADKGEAVCPRHLFMQGVRDRREEEKYRSRILKGQKVSRTPKNRRELLELGYTFIGNGECSKCGEPVDWYRTPNLKNAPYNRMLEIETPSISHFATCTCVASFRKTA